MAILPVPDDQGAPGFARARRLASRRASLARERAAGPSVALGNVLHHGEPAGAVHVPLAALNRHVLVVGTTGSGKTTTVLSLLTRLWRDHRIPFLAIEPAGKKEYRGLTSVPGLEDLQVYTLGREDISPLRLNPMAPPPGVRCETHASSVAAALKLAMPLFPPLPQLLAKAIEHAYERSGWDYDTTAADGVAPPTLRTLLDSFAAVFEAEGYVGEARNVGIAFKVRLEELLTGSRGRLLDTVESSDFTALMERPVVVELSDIADPDDKAVLSAFLLEQVRAVAQAHGSSGDSLRHVTVVEEAHRLLARAHAGASSFPSDGDRSRSDAVRAFCEAIAELRAQGEGFVISSQKPSELAEAAVDNTNTRIIHSLLSADDRRDVLDDLDAGDLDREAAARLRRGEAIVKLPEHDDAVVVRIEPADGVDSGRRVPDEAVAAHMAEARAATQRLLPYPLCTASVCPRGCSSAVRKEGRAIAKAVGPAAGRLWQEAAPRTADALDPISARLVAQAGGDAQLAYCSAAHLAASGEAFSLRRDQDIGPDIEKAIARAVDGAA
jgi:DNA helicase HerA-like ATPase